MTGRQMHRRLSRNQWWKRRASCSAFGDYQCHCRTCARTGLRRHRGLLAGAGLATLAIASASLHFFSPCDAEASAEITRIAIIGDGYEVSFRANGFTAARLARVCTFTGTRSTNLRPGLHRPTVPGSPTGDRALCKLAPPPQERPALHRRRRWPWHCERRLGNCRALP